MLLLLFPFLFPCPQSLSPGEEADALSKQASAAGYTDHFAAGGDKLTLLPSKIQVDGEGKIVTAEDRPPQPRAPVITGRKLYLPEEYVRACLCACVGCAHMCVCRCMCVLF